MKFGRGQKDSTSISLFQNIVYAFHESLEPAKRTKLAILLEKNGAVAGQVDDSETNRGQIPRATHVIAERALQEESDAESTEVTSQYLVTPKWVLGAVNNGHVHHPKYYSPDPSKLFSGMVVSFDLVAEETCSLVSDYVHQYGGQIRSTFDDDVTHIVTSEPRDHICRKAAGKDIKIVSPEWFVTCVKLKRLVDQGNYLFPTTSSKSSSDTANRLPQSDASNSKNSLNNLIYPYPTKTLNGIPEPSRHFLAGYCFYFGPDIEISDEASISRLKELVVKAGATVEESYCNEVNVVIVKYRSSNFYIRACREGKIVATVWWVTNTLQRRRFVPPTQTLLDYPTPRGGIPGMSDMRITTSGYRAIEREHIQRIAMHCGVSVSPKLTKQTTYLISATCTSPKYVQAKKWNIPVVNHLWLEECYQKWENRPISVECYVHQPGETILRDLVGKTAIDPAVTEKWYKDQGHQPMEIPRRCLEFLQQINASGVDSNSLWGTPSGLLKSTKKPETYVWRARKAALNAKNALQQVIVPDMNAYQKERKTLCRQRSDDDHIHREIKRRKLPRR